VLRVVPTREIHLHEEYDAARVGALASAMRRDRVITNPPIVASVPGRKAFALLDGANRVMAARSLGFPHFLVQVVDYDDPAIVLSKWDHLVRNFSDEEFFAALERIHGLVRRPASLADARDTLAARGTFCYVHHARRGTVALSPASRTESEVRLLRAITGIYKDRGSIVRMLLSGSVPEEIGDPSALLLMFPTFTKEDIVRSALSRNEKLPTGISRHVIPNRALRVNLPLALLRSSKSIAAKNRALEAHVAERARRNAIRHYTEATFIYDE
jgi:hypothetical protein